MIVSTTVSWRARASSLVALALASVILAACGSTRSGDAPARPAAPRPAPRTLARPDAVQQAHFALLRTKPEGLPPRVRSLVRARGARIDPALAQRVPALVPGRFWLVPGVGHLCVVAEVPQMPGVGSVCATTGQALKEGLAMVLFTPPGQARAGMPTRLVIGVAPDGTREALVHTRSTVAAAPVERSVFVLRDSEPVTSDFVALRR